MHRRRTTELSEWVTRTGSMTSSRAVLLWAWGSLSRFTVCRVKAGFEVFGYGGSKKEINDVLAHGFACPAADGDSYGRGVCLCPAKFPMDSVLSSEVDESGLRHILLCRVIMGKSEQIRAGSEQFQPSSEEFDTGVDNLEEPNKYIVWSCYMNSHILPSFLISFKAPSLTGSPTSQGPALIPKSPYLSFPKLMSDLETYLVPSEMDVITKYHNAFLAKKITRNQLIRTVRQIAGDSLLKAVIKSSRNKTFENRKNISISGAAGTNANEDRLERVVLPSTKRKLYILR